MVKSAASKQTQQVVYNKGDLVFAKMKGYPYWPARIELLPHEIKSKDKYNILFYGTHQTIDLRSESLLPYNEENKKTHGQEKKLKSFNKALWEIEHDPELTGLTETAESNSGENEKESDNEENDAESKTASSIKSSENNQNSDNELSPDEDELKKSAKSSRKTAFSEPLRRSLRKSNRTASEDAELSETATKSAKVKEKPKTTKSKEAQSEEASNESFNCDDKKPVTPEAPPAKSNSFESVTTETPSPESSIKSAADDNKPLPRTSSRPRQINKRYSINEPENIVESNTPIQNNELDKSRRKLKANSSPAEKPVEVTTQEISADNEKIASIERAKWVERKNAMKLKKLNEKKKAKIRSIRTQSALVRMNVEIKKSLRVDNTDVERCCKVMQDLIKLPIVQRHLFNSPEIVETISKCRKFKGSEVVKKLATECVQKFHYMFVMLPGDSFNSVFEKERDKFLSENVEELKKERAIATKLLENETKTLKTMNHLK